MIAYDKELAKTNRYIIKILRLVRKYRDIRLKMKI